MKAFIRGCGTLVSSHISLLRLAGGVVSRDCLASVAGCGRVSGSSKATLQNRSKIIELVHFFQLPRVTVVWHLGQLEKYRAPKYIQLC
jgi:hypothetical protein